MLQQDRAEPSGEAVTDDLPTWRSEFGEWWEKRLRPFVDLRSFLHQRRLILEHPELSYCTQAPEKQWKRPFEFALSSSLLTFGFCAIVGLLFHVAFPDPDTKHDWIARGIGARIAYLDSELRLMKPTDADYAAAAAAERNAREDLREHVSGLSVPHGNLLATTGVPLLVYLIGVLYPALVRRTRARDAPRAARARAIVYYYFAAKTFWPLFVFVLACGTIYFAERYSILNQYASIAQTYPVASGIGLFIMNFVGGAIAIAFFYALVATPIMIHKCAKRLPELIGVTDASTRRILYWGLHVTVGLAFTASLLIAMFIMGAYLALDTATDHIHQYTGAAFSTTSK